VETDKVDKDGKVQLQVPGKYLRVVREHALANKFDNASSSDGKSYAVSGSNRSSVELAFESLANQLRGKMRGFLLKQGVNLRGVKIGDPRTQDGVEALFREFDGNGDGEISKREFVTKCGQFGIKMSAKEMDLVWPLFDKNGDGSLNVEELLALVAPKPMELTDWESTKDAKAVVMRRMTSQHRAQRIEGKSKLAEHLTRTSVNLRKTLKCYMAEHQLSASAMFENFFPAEVIHRRHVLSEKENKALTLSKVDFQDGLTALGIHDIGAVEMELIWPMFHAKVNRFASKEERMKQKVRDKAEAKKKKERNTSGVEEQPAITLQEWGRFIKGNSWSRELLFDSFACSIGTQVELLERQAAEQAAKASAPRAPMQLSDLFMAATTVKPHPPPKSSASYAITPIAASGSGMRSADGMRSASGMRSADGPRAVGAWGEDSLARAVRVPGSHTKHTNLSEYRLRLATARKERLQRRQRRAWRTSSVNTHTGLDSPACLYRSAHITTSIHISR
jgi:hypothetical protein